MKNGTFLLILCVLCMQSICGNTQEKFRKLQKSLQGRLQKFKKRANEMKALYLESFNITEEDLLGTYKMETQFHFSPVFVNYLKWKIFLKINRKTKYPCEVRKLRKYFNHVKDNSLSKKFNMQQVTVSLTNFLESHNTNKYKVELLRDHDVKINDRLFSLNTIKNKGVRAISKLFSDEKGVKNYENYRLAYWDLKFNFFKGYKTLIINVPENMPYLSYSLQFEMRNKENSNL